MCYLFYGLSVTLIHGHMQFAPLKPNQQINESTNQLTNFSLLTSHLSYASSGSFLFRNAEVISDRTKPMKV